ncbi:hypothetical protein BJ741DRAFT_179748 [Chytriomyces cf. hyalinus JEL632]|nr:hypothetical protein BJ741DRAFT_179748 [Chytriomyces cf. hyalinus JEL632]
MDAVLKIAEIDEQGGAADIQEFQRTNTEDDTDQKPGVKTEAQSSALPGDVTLGCTVEAFLVIQSPHLNGPDPGNTHLPSEPSNLSESIVPSYPEVQGVNIVKVPSSMRERILNSSLFTAPATTTSPCETLLPSPVPTEKERILQFESRIREEADLKRIRNANVEHYLKLYGLLESQNGSNLPAEEVSQSKLKALGRVQSDLSQMVEQASASTPKCDISRSNSDASDEHQMKEDSLAIKLEKLSSEQKDLMSLIERGRNCFVTGYVAYSRTLLIFARMFKSTANLDKQGRWNWEIVYNSDSYSVPSK